MKTGDNIRKRADGRFEARYMIGRKENGKIKYGYAYGKTYAEAKEKRDWQVAKLAQQTGPKRMNMIILGAGSHGREVYEVADGLRVFNKIAFLDDNISGNKIIGKCNDFLDFLEEYPIAIPGVGDNKTRRQWMEKLIQAGFIIPTLIDTTAVVSKEASIGFGTVICARAVVNLGAKIGNGCIISSGAVIATDANMEDWGFINSGESLLVSGEIR